jgi:hypothetical protein
MQFQDLVGQRFNKLVVLKYLGQGKNKQSRWLCQCDCGNKHEAFAHHLKTNNIKSCGCLQLSENRKNSATRYGGTNTPEWTSYHAAKKRCNPKFADKYHDYSSRGIEFRFNSFQEFLEHIGPRPEPKFEYSLDRIDNNGHYEIGNVRWSTKKEQARNRRCNNCEALKARIAELEKQLEEERINMPKVLVKNSNYSAYEVSGQTGTANVIPLDSGGIVTSPPPGSTVSQKLTDGTQQSATTQLDDATLGVDGNFIGKNEDPTYRGNAAGYSILGE